MWTKNSNYCLFWAKLGLFWAKLMNLAKSGAQKHEKSFRMYIVVEGS
nr:MAG TPA: hypothetical protein [Caudoviricetes sp.]